MTGTMPTPETTADGPPHTTAVTRRSRDDVVDVSLRLLDEGGLAGLSMRNIAAALGVRPSALYWHFPNKQSILAAVSDAILARAVTPDAPPSEEGAESRRAAVVRASLAVRDALLSTSDGAEVVASTIALGLGERRPDTCIRAALDTLAPGLAATAAATIATYLLGHTQQWQQRRFAEGIGLVEPAPDDERLEFVAGLDLLLDGVDSR